MNLRITLHSGIIKASHIHIKGSAKSPSAFASQNPSAILPFPEKYAKRIVHSVRPPIHLLSQVIGHEDDMKCESHVSGINAQSKRQSWFGILI
jgi:hypothetical protein